MHSFFSILWYCLIQIFTSFLKKRTITCKNVLNENTHTHTHKQLLLCFSEGCMLKYSLPELLSFMLWNHTVQPSSSLQVNYGAQWLLTIEFRGSSKKRKNWTVVIYFSHKKQRTVPFLTLERGKRWSQSVFFGVFLWYFGERSKPALCHCLSRRAALFHLWLKYNLLLVIIHTCCSLF